MPPFERFNPRTALAMVHDVAASALAWVAAFWLRLNLELPPGHAATMIQTLPLVVAVQALVFWRFGLYRGIWRYASLSDLRRLVIAVIVAALAAPFCLILLRLSDPVPRSVLLLDPLLLLFIMGGSRLLYRGWKEHRLVRLSALNAEPVLVIGAGDTGATLIRELGRGNEWRVIGLLDDNPTKQRRQIHGVPVLGRLEDVQRVTEHFALRAAIIAMPSAPHVVRRRAALLCAQAGIKVMTVPSFDDLVSGKVQVSAIRRIELDDLLGRDPVALDQNILSGFLAGKTILVTGAGGSIGSELCRQIARFEPARLILFELSEFALYQIEQEFRANHTGLDIVCAVGDARNHPRVEQILREYRPRVVFHAAAYKHVPLMEEVNAWEAVQNNVLGTHVLASAAAQAGVEAFVMVSTDKAVNPVNVMGATKRLAEMVCQALQREIGTRYVMVRFGNVLGSAGSVIPKFRQQIADGGPITVTHPDITRFFMSIPEAAQLVLQAGAMGHGGEIFVLDMGEPVRIVDLARELIRLSGLREDDIEIVFSGLRPGEKLYEEVLADDERTLATPHPKLRIARARGVAPDWLPRLMEWLGSAGACPDDQVRVGLSRFVPEYSAARDERPAQEVAKARYG
ncbi:MAG TPA: nucleoside-diphosphate sugar epimerase/dehydratase [Burkholderiales bacterium]|nr:nucleoside-diphosphate sugar epimerase/dehydratase [Burkholderiales bacterium]